MAIVLSTQSHTEKDEAGAYGVSQLILARNTVALTADDVRAALPPLGTPIAVGSATAYLRTRSLEKRPRSGGRAWMVQLEYATQRIDAEFTVTNGRVGTNLVNIWRTGPTPPANLSAPTTIDITGTPVDTAGDPATEIIPRVERRVRNILTSVPLATYASVAGKRNNATFLGFAAGYLLYLGATDDQTEPGRFEVVHEFVYDGWAHLRQQPKLDQDRQPKIGSPDGNGIARAEHVFWVQPFPAVADFTTLGITL